MTVAHAPVVPVGVVAGTPLGQALAERLEAGGREVVAATHGAALERLARTARVVVVDAAPNELPAVLRTLGELLDGNHLVVHTVRGLTGGRRPAELIADETAVRRIGVLAGPLRVADLRAGHPAAAVVASRHPEVVDEAATALSTPTLRVYRSRDPVAIEVASGVAELVALGCGVIDGRELGASARVLLLSRAVREMQRMVAALGGDPLAACGLGGLGDILARADDPEDPAYRHGLALARGETPPKDADGAVTAALTETIQTLLALATARKTPVRVLGAVGELVLGKLDAAQALDKLMRIPVLDD